MFSYSEKISSHFVLARNGFLTRCSKTKCIVLSHEHPSILYLLCSSPLVNCFTTRYKFVPGKSLKEEKPFFRPKKTVTELQSKDKAIKEQRSSTKGKTLLSATKTQELVFKFMNHLSAREHFGPPTHLFFFPYELNVHQCNIFNC